MFALSSAFALSVRRGVGGSYLIFLYPLGSPCAFTGFCVSSPTKYGYDSCRYVVHR